MYYEAWREGGGRPHQQKGAPQAQRPDDGRQADLGGLVNEDDIEGPPAGQQRVPAGEARRCDEAGAGR